MDATESAAQARRSSAPPKHSQAWNRQLPDAGSKSQLGSLSVQTCLFDGVPSPLSTTFCKASAVSSWQSVLFEPPPGMRSGGTSSVQLVVHLLPGVPLAGPSSHCSLHSTMPSPQRSSRQVGAHPSHATWFPSSHCSPISTLPLPQTAVFGVQVSVTWFERSRAPRPSRAAMLNVLEAARPAGCGTVRPVVAEQWSWSRSGAPGIRTFVPAFTVRPRPAMVLFNAVPLAASTASAGFSTFGLLIEIDSIWIGLQLGIRASVTWSQIAVWKTHLPSVLPSWSQPGSPSMQDCVGRGKPLLTLPFCSCISNSAMHELRVRPPGKSRSPPGSGTTLQFASHPLPG